MNETNAAKTKKCSNCDSDIEEAKFFLHERMCANIIKRCECGEPVEIELMEEHIKEAHTEVNCKFCKKSFNKRKIEMHQKACNSKPKPCQFCEMEISGNELKDHEQICGSKTEVCTICKVPVMLKEYEDHTIACSIRESSRVKNEQIANEKMKEQKIKRELEEEKKRLQEEQNKKLLEEKKKFEEKRKIEEKKRIEDERKKEEEKRRTEEKIKEEKRKQEEKTREDKKREDEKKRQEEEIKKRMNNNEIRNPISNNKSQPKQSSKIEINNPKNSNELKEINKKFVKDALYEKKENNIFKNKYEKPQLSYQPKPAKDYIEQNFKDPRPINKIETKPTTKPTNETKKVSPITDVKPNKNPISQPNYFNINEINDNYINNNVSKTKKANQGQMFNDDELIRKLQLQEDEKLARELYIYD